MENIIMDEKFEEILTELAKFGWRYNILNNTMIKKIGKEIKIVAVLEDKRFYTEIYHNNKRVYWEIPLSYEEDDLLYWFWRKFQ